MVVPSLSRGSALLAAVGALALAAGFLFAANVTGAEYATVGTVDGADEAYAIPVDDDGDRLRFQLEATGTEPSVSLSVFDPEDTFLTSVELSGDGDAVDVLADDPGDWVVFVEESREGRLIVKQDDDGGVANLTELPVRGRTQTLVAQEGGPADEHVVFQLDRPPATAELAWSGNVSGLDARVASEQGVVAAVEDGEADETGSTARSHESHPVNLAAGTYEANLEAEMLAGEVTFVTYEYLRDAVELGDLPKDAKLEAARNGTRVAEIASRSAVAFDPLGADEVLFWTDTDAHAHVRVYDSRDRFVDEVSLGPHPEDCECQHGEHDDEIVIAQFVALDDPGEHVAYVDEIVGEGDVVRAVVPEVDAPQGTALRLEHHELPFQHGAWGDSEAKTIDLAGALVEATVDASDVASTDRNVTIESPLGPVLYYEEATQTRGTEVDAERQVIEEHLTAGSHKVRAEAGSAAGTTYVRLVNYVR